MEQTKIIPQKIDMWHPESHEAFFKSSPAGIIHGGNSKTRDVAAKILIADDKGNLIPCSYQNWHYAEGDMGYLCGIIYIALKEKPVNPEDLIIVKQEIFRSRNKERSLVFDEFVTNLMHNPPADVQFIKYDGVETSPREYRHFLFIRIPKRQKIKFKHHFSLYKLQTSSNIPSQKTVFYLFNF
jgi:hypothetical protein